MEIPKRILRMVPAGLAAFTLASCGAPKPVEKVHEFKMGAPAPGTGLRFTPSGELPKNCQLYVTHVEGGKKVNLLNHKEGGTDEALDFSDGSKPIISEDEVVLSSLRRSANRQDTLDVAYRYPVNALQYEHTAVMPQNGAQINLGRDGLNLTIIAAVNSTPGSGGLVALGELCRD